MAIAVILLIIEIAHLMNFKWTLGPVERFCFEDNLPQKTLVNALLEANKNYSVGVQVISPDGSDLYRDVTSAVFHFSFATIASGNHKFCLHNFDNENKTVKIKFDVGIDAKNYTNHIIKPDLSALDFDVEKLQDMLAQLKADLNFLYEKSAHVTNVNEGTSNRIIFFGIITIMILICSSFVQILSIRKFLIQKKIA